MLGSLGGFCPLAFTDPNKPVDQDVVRILTSALIRNRGDARAAEADLLDRALNAKLRDGDRVAAKLHNVAAGLLSMFANSQEPDPHGHLSPTRAFGGQKAARDTSAGPGFGFGYDAD